jgi:hypothetical protein
MLGPHGPDLAEEEPWRLAHVDRGHRWQQVVPGEVDSPTSCGEVCVEWATCVAWLNRADMIGRLWYTSASGLATAAMLYDRAWDYGSMAAAVSGVQKQRRKVREGELHSISSESFLLPMTPSSPAPACSLVAACFLLRPHGGIGAI